MTESSDSAGNRFSRSPKDMRNVLADPAVAVATAGIVTEAEAEAVIVAEAAGAVIVAEAAAREVSAGRTFPISRQ